MLTLKIRWTSCTSDGILADEATLFIPADEVTVHGQLVVIDDDPMQGWEEGSYFEYRSVTADGTADKRVSDGRLIKVRQGETETWYTASYAWVLGPTGATIERVAP